VVLWTGLLVMGSATGILELDVTVVNKALRLLLVAFIAFLPIVVRSQW
jgi:hypothetical protein